MITRDTITIRGFGGRPIQVHVHERAADAPPEEVVSPPKEVSAPPEEVAAAPAPSPRDERKAKHNAERRAALAVEIDKVEIQIAALEHDRNEKLAPLKERLGIESAAWIKVEQRRTERRNRRLDCLRLAEEAERKAAELRAEAAGYEREEDVAASALQEHSRTCADLESQIARVKDHADRHGLKRAYERLEALRHRLERHR